MDSHPSATEVGLQQEHTGGLRDRTGEFTLVTLAGRVGEASKEGEGCANGMDGEPMPAPRRGGTLKPALV